MIRALMILAILYRYRIEECIGFYANITFLRVIACVNPFYFLTCKLSRGQRICQALEALGPLYVKFGQLLSTRDDILPFELVSALEKLQDKVKPFSSAIAKKIIQQEMKSSLKNTFRHFSKKPLASASIAQVHAAELLNQDAVIVKVLRPNIHQKIRKDLRLLKCLARFFLHGKASTILQELEEILNAETDLRQEARNAERMRRNAAALPDLLIPEVYQATSKIMIMERIYGIPVSKVAVLKSIGADTSALAKRIISLFLIQVFEDNFFHADLHPGNIFINEYLPSQYIFVDFGIVGSLNEFDQRYIAENMLAFFNQDYQRLAELHKECGWLPDDASLQEFEAAMRSVAEPIFSKPLKEISIAQLLLRMIQIARESKINIQPQLVLIQKTLLNVESIARTLDPDLDIWGTAQPYLERWLRRKMGWRYFLKQARRKNPS